MKQKIFVLYTGGTIGMVQSSNGLQPDTDLVDNALQPFSDKLEFDWHVCTPLIDSSAITLENWRNWLVLLVENIPKYDGVLILHGTDTMAYTANLLALALRNLEKPIILTGSQWTYNAANSDAPLNLATAVAAFEPGLSQVAIAFNGKLFPAVGCSKVSTETAAGFDNPHFGAMARWHESQGWKILDQHQMQEMQELPSSGFPQTKKISDDQIQAFHLNPQVRVLSHILTPGFAVDHLADNLEDITAQALILQSYGHGNAPSDDKFIHAVKRFTAKGGLVLNISQVAQGCVAAVYAQGNALRQAGVVSGGKCNLETAVALMTLAISNNWTAETVRQKLIDLNLTAAS